MEIASWHNGDYSVCPRLSWEKETLRRPRHLPTYGQESLESNQCHCAVFQVIKRSDPTDYRAAAMRGASEMHVT
jgi:hypothetical protein